MRTPLNWNRRHRPGMGDLRAVRAATRGGSRSLGSVEQLFIPPTNRGGGPLCLMLKRPTEFDT